MTKLRVIQVGCGGISRSWLATEAYQELVDLVALVDLNPDGAKQLRKKAGLADDLPFRTDLAAAIAEFQPDAIFDTTVPEAHHAVTTTALAAGCHVLGEKPMAASMDQALAMVAAASAADRVYAVTQTRRWHGMMRRAAEVLASGAIGQPHSFFAEFSIAAHFGGFRAEMDHVLLLDMAIHSFDSARQLIGAVDPAWVQAAVWNPPASRYRHGANACATFGFADGSMFDYRGTWTANGAQTSWDCDWRIHGDRGALLISDANGLQCERTVDPDEPSAGDGGPLIRTLESVPLEPCSGPRKGGHDGAIRDFVEAVTTGRAPACPAADNIKSLAMVHAAIAAAASGAREPVTWSASPASPASAAAAVEASA